MKLKNKKTGEVVETGDNYLHLQGKYLYSSLAEFNEEWEDYEEPKGWCITMYGGISRITKDDEILISDLKEIGNCFNDKESAYDALDKLKAWKRLKEARMDFKDYHYELEKNDVLITYKLEIKSDGFAYEDFTDDLDLLFGGEE